MGKSASTPSAPTLGQDIKDVLAALPSLYSGSANYNPLFSSLNMSGLEDALFGTEATTTPNYVKATQAGWYDEKGNLVGTDKNQYTGDGGGRGGVGHVAWNTDRTSPGGTNIPAGIRWIGKGGTVTSGNTDVPAQRGLVSLYGSANTGVRDANKAANPQMYNLLDRLTSSASSDLALGNKLNPNQTRLVEQSARSGQAARGLGFGPSDVIQESIMATGYGDQLEQQRKAWAAQVLGLDQSFAVNDSNQAMGLIGANGSSIANSSPINSLLGLARDSSMSNWNARNDNATNNANNQAALIGAGVTAAGTIL